jgi:predicted nucleotidyltransferase
VLRQVIDLLATEIGNLVQRVGWNSVMLELVENIDDVAVPSQAQWSDARGAC